MDSVMCASCKTRPVPRHEWPADRSYPILCSTCLRSGGTQTIIGVQEDLDVVFARHKPAAFSIEGGLLNGNMPSITTGAGTKFVQEKDVLLLLDVVGKAGGTCADVAKFLVGMKPS